MKRFQITAEIEAENIESARLYMKTLCPAAKVKNIYTEHSEISDLKGLSENMLNDVLSHEKVSDISLTKGVTVVSLANTEEFKQELSSIKVFKNKIIFDNYKISDAIRIIHNKLFKKQKNG